MCVGFGVGLIHRAPGAHFRHCRETQGKLVKPNLGQHLFIALMSSEVGEDVIQLQSSIKIIFTPQIELWVGKFLNGLDTASQPEKHRILLASRNDLPCALHEPHTRNARENASSFNFSGIGLPTDLEETYVFEETCVFNGIPCGLGKYSNQSERSFLSNTALVHGMNFALRTLGSQCWFRP